LSYHGQEDLDSENEVVIEELAIDTEIADMMMVNVGTEVVEVEEAGAVVMIDMVAGIDLVVVEIDIIAAAEIDMVVVEIDIVVVEIDIIVVKIGIVVVTTMVVVEIDMEEGEIIQETVIEEVGVTIVVVVVVEMVVMVKEVAATIEEQQITMVVIETVMVEVVIDMNGETAMEVVAMIEEVRMTDMKAGAEVEEGDLEVDVINRGIREVAIKTLATRNHDSIVKFNQPVRYTFKARILLSTRISMDMFN